MSLGRLPQLILGISHDARTRASSRADTLQSPVKVTKTVMMKYSGQNEGSADLVITPHHESEGLISFHGRPGQVSVSQKLVTAPPPCHQPGHAPQPSFTSEEGQP